MPSFSGVLMKMANRIVQDTWTTPDIPSYGQEIEYDPAIYGGMTMLMRAFENYVLSGMWDGSGPRELRLPPINLFDYDAFRVIVRMLRMLRIRFTESNTYPYGRHIHIKPFNNLTRVFNRNLDYMTLLLSPFMGMIKEQRGDYLMVHFRREVQYWANPFIKYDDHYRFVSLSFEHGTIEIRINERSPIEAYTAMLIYYAWLKLYDYLPFAVYKNEENETVVLHDGENGKVAIWEGNIIKVSKSVLRKFINQAFNYLSDNTPKRIMKLARKVVRNVMRGNYVVEPMDIDMLYPELI